jgi:hypothetical protein
MFDVSSAYPNQGLNTVMSLVKFYTHFVRYFLHFLGQISASFSEKPKVT